jgi:AcrR family transcriptional regulator
MDAAPAHDRTPEGLDTEAPGWQQRKSAQTRVAILEAAIDRLGKVGWARTTTQEIAEAAGVSRGAMLHHYATKLDLVAGVIDYIFWRRMRVFAEQVGALSERARVEEQQGLELLWQTMLGREYQAQVELAVAAKTDSDLAMLYEPAAVRFNQAWRAEIGKLFPEWDATGDRLMLAVDFAQATLDGLLLNRPTWPERERRVAVRQLLNTALLMFRDGRIEIG